METRTTATAAYKSPEIKVILIDIEGLICQSPQQQDTGLGSFSQWED